MRAEWFWFWWFGWTSLVLLCAFYVRCMNRALDQKQEFIRLARQRDIEDPGKEAVLTNLNTVVDYEKGQVLFRCQGCREIVHQVGDVEIPKGGLCASCSAHLEGIPIKVAEANMNEHMAYVKRVMPDVNGDPPAPKDVDEELAKQREEIATARADLARQQYKLEALRRSVDRGVYDHKETVPTFNPPAWARDALWGMGLSGIGLAFAWVATLIF